MTVANRFFLITLVLLFMFMNNAPVSLIPIAGHDDGLFMRLGMNIYNGYWLGSYSQFTLMKGPGFPFVLAFLSFFKIPLQIFYSAICVLTAILVRRTLFQVTGYAWFSVFVSLILVLYPAFDSTRVLRDNLSNWLALILSLLCINILYCISTGQQNKLKMQMIVFSILIGFFYTIREESLVFTLPVFFVIFMCYSFHFSSYWAWMRLFKYVVFAFVFPSLFMTVNYFKYGDFLLNDFKETNFVQALRQLQSIDDPGHNIRTSVSERQRAVAYEVSPAFATLRPFLEGADAPLAGWKKPGCELYSDTCNDYATAWFSWALRDAVALSGNYKSPQQASFFYEKVYSEILAACSENKIQCTYKLVPLPVVGFDNADVLRFSAKKVLSMSSFFDKPPVYGMPSAGSANQLEIASKFISSTNILQSIDKPLQFHGLISQGNPDSDHFNSYYFAVRSFLIDFYAVLIPAIYLIGFISLVCLMFSSNGAAKFDPLFFYGISMIFIGGVRLLMLVYLDAVAFAPVNFHYIGYAVPLFVLGSIFLTCSMFNRYRHILHRFKF